MKRADSARLRACARITLSHMRRITYVGIPALDGNTYPLRWYSEPKFRTWNRSRC